MSIFRFILPLLLFSSLSLRAEEDCLFPPAADLIDTIDVERPLLDIDALAVRMKARGEWYQSIRNAALAEYDRLHPEKAPADAEAKALIRLYAYLVVWDDFYGEDLWDMGVCYARKAIKQGSDDPFVKCFETIRLTNNFTARTDEQNQKEIGRFDAFLQSGYPAAFKLRAMQGAIYYLAKYNDKYHPPAEQPSMVARFRYVVEWGRRYREMIRAKAPNEWLYFLGADAQEKAVDDAPALDRLIGEQDRAFDELAPESPVRLELDGQYWVKAAWNARGADWASEVTEKGWNLFAERLAKAQGILEPLYERYPKEVGTCDAMMTVELGQAKGRERMEKWYGRYVDLDPDSFHARAQKLWYLQPRWFGSVDDLLAFGQECVRAGNWGAKIPMVLPVAISRTDNESLYAQPRIWDEVSKVYEAYFERYPNAVFYRTSYAKHAHDGGHKDVAKEQLKILGRWWDCHVISIAEHAQMTAALGMK